MRAAPNSDVKTHLSIRPLSGVKQSAAEMLGSSAFDPKQTQKHGSEAFSRQAFLGVWLQLKRRCARQ
jgi:hypothetical protein